MAQGDRDVRLCPAEARHEVARREQSFFPGRAEPQEQLAERDHPRHGVLPRWRRASATRSTNDRARAVSSAAEPSRSEEHTSELQSRLHLVCRLLLEKKKEH